MVRNGVKYSMQFWILDDTKSYTLDVKVKKGT